MEDLDPVGYQHQPAPRGTTQGTVVAVLACTMVSGRTAVMNLVVRTHGFTNISPQQLDTLFIVGLSKFYNLETFLLASTIEIEVDYIHGTCRGIV
jgi:hypothetical protein